MWRWTTSILQSTGRRVRKQSHHRYLEPPLGQFKILAVEVQPLLNDLADLRVGVVHQLEACDVGPASLELCEVQIQEALVWENTESTNHRTDANVNKTQQQPILCPKGGDLRKDQLDAGSCTSSKQMFDWCPLREASDYQLSQSLLCSAVQKKPTPLSHHFQKKPHKAPCVIFHVSTYMQ